MRKKLGIALVAVLALLGLVLVVTPAGATQQAIPQVSTVATIAELPADANGTRFWSPQICVQPLANTTGYPIGEMAQRWNVVAGSPLALDLSYTCAADGYPPSRRMFVGVYSANDGHCLKVTQNATAYSNGMYRWTQGPIMSMNYFYPACTGTAARRSHLTSEAIGWGLGMAQFNSAGWNSRVMNNTDYSWDNIPQATYTEGLTVYNLYIGTYGG